MKFSKKVTRSFKRKYHVDTHLSTEFCRILRHFPRFSLSLSLVLLESCFPRKHYILWHSSQYFLKFFLPQTWHISEICTRLFYGYRCALVLSTAILKLKDSYFSVASVFSAVAKMRDNFARNIFQDLLTKIETTMKFRETVKFVSYKFWRSHIH